MRIVPALFVVCCLIRPVWAQQSEMPNPDEEQKGHRLAITVCAICHLAAPDQAHEPSLDPPAPSFESIVQRKDFSAEWLTLVRNPRIGAWTIRKECPIPY